MSIEDATKHFVDPMRVYFGDPPGDYPDLALRDYIKAMQTFLPSVLERTADHLKAIAKRRTWPMIAECVDTAKRFDAEARHSASKDCGNSYRDPEAVRKQRDERDRMADAALFSATAITAAEQGWILEYHEFIRSRGRIPDPREFDRLIADARAYDERLQKRLRTTDPEPGKLPGALDEAIVIAAQAVVNRREYLTAKVLDWANGRAV